MVIVCKLGIIIVAKLYLTEHQRVLDTHYQRLLNALGYFTFLKICNKIIVEVFHNYIKLNIIKIDFINYLKNVNVVECTTYNLNIFYKFNSKILKYIAIVGKI